MPDRRGPGAGILSGPLGAPALAVLAYGAERTADRQHGEDQHGGPAQGQEHRPQLGRERRTAEGGDEGVQPVGGRDTERGRGADPQGRPGGEGDEVGRDRSDGHGDAVAREKPRDERGGHGRGSSGLRGRPGCCWTRTGRTAAEVGGRKASIVSMGRCSGHRTRPRNRFSERPF